MPRNLSAHLSCHHNHLTDEGRTVLQCWVCPQGKQLRDDRTLSHDLLTLGPKLTIKADKSVIHLTHRSLCLGLSVPVPRIRGGFGDAPSCQTIDMWPRPSPSSGTKTLEQWHVEPSTGSQDSLYSMKAEYVLPADSHTYTDLCTGALSLGPHGNSYNCWVVRNRMTLVSSQLAFSHFNFHYPT